MNKLQMKQVNVHFYINDNIIYMIHIDIMYHYGT